jgi:hypothetical protein
MKPEKFISIMLLTLLLSCEMEDQQVDQKIGEVSFETNQYIMNSSFDIDIYVDQEKIGSFNDKRNTSDTETITKLKVVKKLEAGIHTYEVKVYSYNGEPGKSIKGRFIIHENRKSDVFIDFKNYNSWI